MRFENSDKALITALANAEKAVLKAEGASADHFASVNEFRRVIDDYVTHLLTLEQFEPYKKDLDTLKLAAAELRGKASQNSVIAAYVIAAVSIIISVIALITS